MRRGSLHVSLVLALALGLPGCSDNGEGPHPTADKGGVHKDVGADGPVVDARADRGAVDRGREAGSDLVVDVRVVDGSHRDTTGDTSSDRGPKDMARPDTVSPAIYGTITRTASPLLDGRGDLYIGVYLPFPPPPATFKVGGKIISNVDFSKPGTKLQYAIYNVGAGGFSLYVFLDDNKNAQGIFPMPDYGDLVMAAPRSVTIPTTGGLKADVVLSKVQTAADAGGANLGTVKGTITRTVTPRYDAKGPVFVSLHSKVPPGGKIASVRLNNVDLSSPFSSETFFLTGVTPGKYYLRVFLDDNANVNPLFGGGPDKGDLVHSKPIQVRVLAGVVTPRPVVLDAVK